MQVGQAQIQSIQAGSNKVPVSDWFGDGSAWVHPFLFSIRPHFSCSPHLSCRPPVMLNLTCHAERTEASVTKRSFAVAQDDRWRLRCHDLLRSVHRRNACISGRSMSESGSVRKEARFSRQEPALRCRPGVSAGIVAVFTATGHGHLF